MLSPGLDWSKHRIGPPLACRICKAKAACRDEHDRPCHKVCAERELAEQAAALSAHGRQQLLA